MFGGYNCKILDASEVYDFESDNWQSIAPMPIASLNVNAVECVYLQPTTRRIYYSSKVFKLNPSGPISPLSSEELLYQVSSN